VSIEQKYASLWRADRLLQPCPAEARFSGTWKTAGSSEQNFHSEKILHQDPNLASIWRLGSSTAAFRAGPCSGDSTYVIDGVEHASKTDKGVQFWRTVSWKGSTLVSSPCAR